MGCWSDAGIVDWGRTCLGKTTKVLKSGKRYISLSATRAKPSNAEPSNHFPCLRQSGNCSTGIVTHFAIPTTSVNSRLTKRTLSASMVARTRPRSLESCCSAIYLIPPHTIKSLFWGPSCLQAEGGKKSTRRCRTLRIPVTVCFLEDLAILFANIGHFAFVGGYGKSSFGLD